MEATKRTRRRWLVWAAAVSLGAHGQQQEIHRALIERDQQSAEFAARLRAAPDTGTPDIRTLENLHARQLSQALAPLSPEPGVAQPLLPYQRAEMAQEPARVMRFDSPIFEAPPKGAARREPLPLPGGARAGVDPVAPDGLSR